jgi:drug/metabolite transporter (DMT)-like permease
MRNLGKLLLVLSALLWGLGFVATDLALSSGWGVFSILGVRGLLAGLVFLPFSFKSPWYRKPKFIGEAVVAGIVMGSAFVVQIVGQQYSTATNASFLTTLYVVFVPLLCWVFQGRKLRRVAIIGSGLAFLGTFILAFKGSLTWQWGDLLLVLCALLFAVHFLMLERLSQQGETLALTSIQLLVMGVMCTGLMLYTGGGYQWQGLEYVLYLVFMGSGLGFLLQIIGQQKVEASAASLILTLEGLFGAIGAVLLLHEPLTINLVIGGLLMMVAVWLLEQRYFN